MKKVFKRSIALVLTFAILFSSLTLATSLITNALTFEAQLGYYNSTEDSALVTGTTTANKHVATQIFTRQDLPNGTEIRIDQGYKYRPEGWVSLDQKNASRPSQVYGYSTVIVDDEWWGEYNYRAFNISKSNEVDISSSYMDVASHFTITLPNEIKEKTIRVLAIGNSYSNDAFHYAEQIAAEFGYKTEFWSLYQSGCYISKHLDNFNNKTAAYTIYRNGVQVRGSVTMNQILDECHFDYITLQQGSARSNKWSYYYSESNPYIVDLYNAIKAEQPGAEFLIHQTWGYSPAEAQANGHSSSLDHFTAIENCYNKAAELLNLPLAKSGKAVQLAKDYGFLTDDRGGENSIYADEYCHLTNRGDFIAGCVLVETIFGVDTTTKDFTSLFADSKNLTKVAHSAVTGEPIVEDDEDDEEEEEEEEVYYEPKRTMFEYKKSDGYSACLYSIPANTLEAGVEYTVELVSNIAQGSSAITFDLYGVDKSLTEGNKTFNAITDRPSNTGKYTNRLRSSGSYGQVAFSGSNKSNNRKRIYTFTLTEAEVANKKFYMGYSFLGSGSAIEFYIGELKLYKSTDTEKKSLLGIDNYSTDITGWTGPYGTATTLGEYVEYNPSLFNYVANIKYTGTATKRIGILLENKIQKGVKYTISYDYYIVGEHGFDHGIFPMLFGRSTASLDNPYYDRVVSYNYSSTSTKVKFGDKVGGVNKSKNGSVSYTFTIAESETLRPYYWVGFLLQKTPTSLPDNRDFYISNLTLTAEGSDENILPVDQYQYSFGGANSGEKWKENNGWIRNGGTGFADSSYVAYGTGDGNIDGEVDIRDLVTADETIDAAGFNPFLDTNVDRTVDKYDINNIRYRLLGLGITAPKPGIKPEIPEEPQKPEYKVVELNDADQAKFVKALQAMRGSKFKSHELIKFLYRVAFSITPIITEDAGTVVNKVFVDTSAEKASDYISITVPGMFGGKKFTDEMDKLLPGEQKSSIEISDIIPGDIICVLSDANDLTSGRFYTTDGENLYDLTDTCEMLSDTSALDNIASNDLFVILRPSSSIKLDTSINTNEIPDGETDFEKAIIATAESFLLRGDRMQYGDSTLVQTDPKIYRWERGKSPEDYTSDETGYSNCTGFVHDVYYNVTGKSYGDFKLADAPASMKAYTYNFTHTETEGKKAQIEAEYKAQLKIGDIVFYTYSGNTHAMLYVGDGNMIHCTGGVYAEVSSYKEEEEAAIRYMQLDELFNPNNSSRYLFQTAKPRTALYIIRPSNTLDTDITDTARLRIGDMNGIFAEKTASATLGQTVNAGDTITYTFKVFNTNEDTVTVDITDRIPENTVLVRNGAVEDERELSWEISVAPNEIKTISYTVKVNEDVSDGTAIVCTEDSQVGGIPTKAYPVYVGRTLTKEEQEILRSIVYSKVDYDANSVTFANSIYEELFGVKNILGNDISALNSGIFTGSGSYKTIATEGKYAQMIAPSLYGGTSVLNSERFGGERTRIPREHNLIPGDILYLQGTSSSGLYIYMGDGEILNLSKGLTKRNLTDRLSNTIGWSKFAVLRPSLAVEKTDPSQAQVILSKSASKSQAQTVLPGETVTYTLNLENITEQEQTVSVIDILPDNTTFVSGCDNVAGDVLKWKVTIPAGETRELSYDFKVQKDNSLCGSVINSSAVVNGQITKCYDLYIERTASSKEDQRFLSNGIRAMKDSTYKGIDYIKWSYYVAFTKNGAANMLSTPEATLAAIMDGSASENLLNIVAPTLYGGTSLTSQIAGVKGAPANSVSTADLIVGDVIIIDYDSAVKCYIYDKDGLVDAFEKLKSIDTQLVLDSLSYSTAFVVLRPSINISRDYIIDEEMEELELTEQQEALIATAESYILRGEKLQYADTRFGGIDNTEYRWNTGDRNPEFVNRDEWGYINCAGFTYEAYNTALGVNLAYGSTKLWSTTRLADNASSAGIQAYRFTRSASTVEDEATRERIKKEVLETIKPGDLMVIIRNGSNSGHVVLYIGNGTFIHSTGSTYKVDDGEYYEPTIRYNRVEDYFFTEASGGYIFYDSTKESDSQVIKFVVVRPLKSTSYNVAVPQETVNRMNNMQGIMAQKISSHNSTTTANRGEEITYSFELYNTNDTAKTVQICDTVPANTTYVLGAQTKDGDNLSWSVTIPANTRTTVSYTVRVNDDAAYGDFVQTTDTSTVGGVRVICPKVYINRTLSVEEQDRVVAAFNSIKNTTSNRGFALVNEIYKTAGLTEGDVFADTDFLTVTEGAEGTFKVAATVDGNSYFQLNEKGTKYRDMMVETLYGGRRYYGFSGDARTDRTRLARLHHIMVGDILVRRISDKNGVKRYYVYINIGGDNYIDITSSIAPESTTAKKRLELMLSAGNYYAVYRPSFNIE